MCRTPPENAPLVRRQFPPWLVFTSYALLAAAWVMGNPPASAPDEWSHYLRVVGLAHGQLVGTASGIEGAMAIVGPTRPPSLDEKTYQDELAWVAQNTRKVRIPAGLTPGWFRCGQQQTDPLISARCFTTASPLDQPADWFTPSGTYQPLPYLLPAAISWVDVSPDNLERLMRAWKAILSLAFVGSAAFLLWSAESRLISLIGLIVAITPMMVFLSATLNPSGLEIASALAFAAALLRLTRESAGRDRWHWIVLGASGAVLSLSRTQGPLWVVLLLGVVLTTGAPSGLLRLLVEQKRRCRLTAIVVLVAIVLNRVWEYAYGPRLAFDPWPLASSLSQGIAQLPAVLREQVGVFNYLEVSMPRLAYAVWGALLVALATTAMLVGTTWQRLHLFLSIGAALALPVVLVATTMRHTGFGLQGRYVLSFSVVVPLLAGEILVRRHDRLRSLDVEHLFFPFAVGVGFVQLLAWWTNAWRFAVGMRGPRWFLSSAEWHPPLGWWPWLVLAVIGAGLLIASPLFDRFVSGRRSSIGRPDSLEVQRERSASERAIPVARAAGK